jgi:TRAP-type C4-dicarboxylate transport system permease small subunit
VGRIISFIDKLCLCFIGTALIAVVSICIIQVIARYAFNASFSWAEEISAIIVLWAVWIGGSLAAKSNSHLRLSLFEKKFRPRNRLYLCLMQKALIIFFAVAMAYASKVVLNVNENITLMSLPIPVNVMYWSVPVGCTLITINCLRSMLNDYREFLTTGTER